MSHGWALSPWVQVPFGLVFLLVGVSGPWVFAEDDQRAELLEAGRTCATGTPVGATDCLVPVEGSLTDARGRTSKRYRFQPFDPGLDDAWVRFPGDETREGGAMPALLGGAPATALYAGDEVVAFEVGGERVLEMSGEPGAARGGLWMGLGFASLGALGLLGAWTRHRADRPRRGWDDLAPGTAPRRPDPTQAAPLPTVVLLSTMLGGFGAFFAGSLRAELVTFTAVAVPFGTWLWWARRRALARLRR